MCRLPYQAPGSRLQVTRTPARFVPTPGEWNRRLEGVNGVKGEGVKLKPAAGQ
jgi:hypothetical protein